MTTSNKVVMQWVLLGVAVFLVALFTSYFLHAFLIRSWVLALVFMVAMEGVGGLAVFTVVRTVEDAKTYLRLEANLMEIRTQLTFHTLVKGTNGYAPGLKKEN
jgi:hypothetical protein